MKAIKAILSLSIAFGLLWGSEEHNKRRLYEGQASMFESAYLSLRAHHRGNNVCVHIDSTTYLDLQQTFYSYCADTAFFRWKHDHSFRIRTKSKHLLQ